MFAPLMRTIPSDMLAEPVLYPETLERFDEYVEFVAAAMCNAADVVLVAESFSGPIAVSILRKSPHNLRAIVLVATFTTAPRALLRSLSTKVPSAIVYAFVPSILKLFCANGNTDPEVLRLAADVVGRVPVEVLRRRLQLLGKLPKDLAVVLNEASVPVLMLEPTQDRLVPMDGFASCTGANAQTQKIAGPHFLLQACPRACWEAIAKFLAMR